MGDPNEPTDPIIRQALVDALPERAPYPLAAGPARAARGDRRAGASGASASSSIPDTEIVPTFGSKEAIFSLAQVLVDPQRTQARRRLRRAGYPVYERGALFAGARGARRCRSCARTASCPTSTRSTERRGASSGSTTRTTRPARSAPLAFYERARRARAREHDFVLASDEAYTELWFDEPPVSALQVADRSRVIVFQTLCKRSSMTGYRSRLRRRRRRSSIARAEGVPADGRHGAAGVRPARVGRRLGRRAARRGDARALRGEARRAARPRSRRKGWEVVASDATMYLWVAVPDAGRRRRRELLERGVVVSPGLVLRPERRGLRPLRARADARGVRARSGDPRREL